jgi:S1-C subfamily serine protease
VNQVQPGSPGERAGLRVGDRIEAVNGRTLQDADDLARTMRAIAPGTEIVVTVTRNGTRIEQRVTLGRLPQ